MGLGRVVNKHGYRVCYTKELKELIRYIVSKTDRDFIVRCGKLFSRDMLCGKEEQTIIKLCEDYYYNTNGTYFSYKLLLDLTFNVYDGKTFEEGCDNYLWFSDFISVFEEYGFVIVKEEDYFELVSNTVSEDNIKSVAVYAMKEMLFEDEALRCNLLCCGLDENEFSCLVGTLKNLGITEDLEIQDWVMEAVGLKNDALKGNIHDTKHLCLVSKDSIGKHVNADELLDGYTIVNAATLSNPIDMCLAYREFDK